MAQSPNLGDLLGAFGGANPLAGIGKTLDQFKRGVNDFLVAVETFNKTMNSMGEVANRVSRLMDDVEPPIRALMPQITRVIETGETVMAQISEPIERVAPALAKLAEPVERVVPGLAKLAETLATPSFTGLSRQLGDFLDTLGQVGRGLEPLANIAETAGGLFGLRGLGRLAGGPQRLSDRRAEPVSTPAPEPASPSVTQPVVSNPAPAKAPPPKPAPPTKAPSKPAAKKPASAKVEAAATKKRAANAAAKRPPTPTAKPAPKRAASPAPKPSPKPSGK